MNIFAETERLVLRELLPTDAAGIFELDSDSEVQRYVGNSPLKTIDQAHEIIALIRKQYVENGIGRWAIIDKNTNNFLGWTGLKFYRTPINDHQNFYELGYRLIRKYWGMGYATESVVASLNYGFQQMKLTEIFAMAHKDNLASHHVLTKAGLRHTMDFMHEGQLEKWFEIKSNRVDAV